MTGTFTAELTFGPWQSGIMTDGRSYRTITAGSTFPQGSLGLWIMSDLTTTARSYVPNRVDTTASNNSLLGPARRNFNNGIFWANVGLTITDSNAVGPDGLTEASTVTNAGSNWFISPYLANSVPSYLPAGTYTIGINVRWKGTGSADFRMGEVGSSLTTKTATSSWARYTKTITITTNPLIVMMYTPDTTSAANFEICNGELFSGSTDLGPQAVGSHIYFQKLTAAAANPSVASGLIDMNTNTLLGYLQFPSSQAIGPFSFIWNGQYSGTGADATFRAILANMVPNTSWSTFATGPIVNTFYPTYLAGAAIPIGVNLATSHLDSLGRNNSTSTVTYDGSTLKLYSGGVLLGKVSQVASSQNLKDLFFCAVQNTFYSGMKVGGIALWARALTTDEVITATSFVAAAVGSAGTTDEPTRFILFEGDSITSGTAAGNNQGYTAKACETATQIIRASNIATGGASVATLSARIATALEMIPSNKSGKKFIAHVLVGTNDLGSGNAAAFTASLQSYLAALRAGGYDKIVCGTIISRTDQGDAGAQFAIDSAAVNTTIRGWVGTVIDAVADYANVALLGAVGAANNTTYFADKIHPTTAGHALMYPVTTAAISGLWGY